MGAKLSKKKKGYCLGAGKDGESTDTTEVEQKETEAQVGQKDAAEPNGENPPTDQTLNNGASEEQKTHVEKNGTEVPSGETTKDDLNKDQKSESKPSAEQKKVEESNQEQDKPEHGKSSDKTPQMATEGGKVQSQPEEKQKDHDKEKESVAKDEPKPVTEQESLEPKQQSQPVTEPSAPVLEQKEVAKPVPDPETKVQVEKMEKEQKSVPTTEHLLAEATIEPTPVTDTVKEPEKLTEIVEPLVSETAAKDPVFKEPVSASEAELVEPAKKMVEPETTEVSLPETELATEFVKPDLAPEPVSKSVESKVSEEPVAPVAEVKSVEPVAHPELVPCPEPEQLSETKEETESLPEPLPSNEVPDSTAQVEENVKNHKTLGNVALGKELVETQAATTESAPVEQPSAEKIPVAGDGPSEQAVEEKQEHKAQDTISTGQEVEKKGMQHDLKTEESISDKPPTEHGSLEQERDRKDTEEVALDISKNEGDQAVHDVTQDKKSEDDKAENHEMPAEELSHEPSAPLIVDKHGVGNGLPPKEEVKVHLENGCGKDLHDLNGQGEGHETEVCNK